MVSSEAIHDIAFTKRTQQVTFICLCTDMCNSKNQNKVTGLRGSEKSTLERPEGGDMPRVKRIGKEISDTLF